MGNDRRYDVLAMTFEDRPPPPWSIDGWQLGRPALDRIFARRKPAIRAFLFPATGSGWAKVGRLSWSEESFRKWLAPADGATFSMADFASPSLGTFDRTRQPPDVYANLFEPTRRFTRAAEGDTFVEDPGGFFVAIALDDPARATVHEAVRALARSWSATALGVKERTWAPRYIAGTFTAIDPPLIQASLRPDVERGWTMLDPLPPRPPP